MKRSNARAEQNLESAQRNNMRLILHEESIAYIIHNDKYLQSRYICYAWHFHSSNWIKYLDN